jgi:2,3-bisphosphoglycerate-dependent phosphoglycerate mutase
MPATLSVYLVRHGESAANLDKQLNRTHADHAVPLSDAGHVQALEAGVFLRRHLIERGVSPRRCAAYVSPYRRTRETWEGVRKGLGDDVALIPHVESIFLRELEFGLFDGVPDEDLPKEFPLEYAHYEKCKKFGGEFYARMPGGESRCDVAQRVHQFFGTLHRDHERHGVDHAFIVSHGVTIRTFVMMWLNMPPEWIERERNPKNCSIRLIEGGTDRGYILNGHPGHRTAQEIREEGTIDGEPTYAEARSAHGPRQ